MQIIFKNSNRRWFHNSTGIVSGESVALLVGRRTNNRKVAGSRPTKVVCITVLTGNRMGWTVRYMYGRPPLLLPSCRKLEFRLSVFISWDISGMGKW